MGAGSSFIVPPEGIDSATFKQLFPEHFSKALFRELAGRSGRISAATLQEFAMQATDVFLSHDWGTDELGRSNHKRVGVINRILKEKGLRTWFDEEEMKGNVQEQMQKGIDKASCIIVFVTENYMEKVAGQGKNGEKDNCRFEFNYVSVTKSPSLIIPVVMEPRCYDNSGWFGPVSAQLRAKLYVDYASDDAGRAEAAAEHIIREIRGYVPLLIKERIAEAVEKFSSKATANSVSSWDGVNNPSTNLPAQSDSKSEPNSQARSSDGADRKFHDDEKHAAKESERQDGAKSAKVSSKSEAKNVTEDSATQADARTVQSDESKYLDEVHADDASSLYTIGRRYETGDGVERDLAEAVRCYWEAAEKGSADAQFALGKCYEEGKGVKADPAEAFKWYKKAADHKSNPLRAQRRLAQCFKDGFGVKPDKNEAFIWYRIAAEHGDSESLVEVGMCYENGYGVPEDKAEAFDWYSKAAKQGNVKGQRRVADCYMCGAGVGKNEVTACEWYIKAAEQGDITSQFRLGMIYLKGCAGIEIDKDKASEWFMKMVTGDISKGDAMKIKTTLHNAIKGNGVAQFKLGEIFEKGNGFAASDHLAFEWYHIAAEQDISEAQRSLGHCYMNGRGVEVDRSIAVEWYKKAANRGDAEAQRCLGKCYEEGTGVDTDKAQAFEWYRKAAEQGDQEAEYRIGKCYEMGKGIGKDEGAALSWIRKAAERGHMDAIRKLGDINTYGRSEMKSNVFEGFKRFVTAAEKGDASARDRVESGFYGHYVAATLSEDKADIFEWYLKAAELGLKNYQRVVAKWYEFGIGTERSVTEAFKWYMKAAEIDPLYACEVGRCYYDGIGVTTDRDLAFEFYEKVFNNDFFIDKTALQGSLRKAIQGHVESQLEIANYFVSNKTRGSHSPFCALSWYLSAAKQGYVQAQFKAAELYEKGFGDENSDDIRKAFEWYLKAAEQGHAEAQFRAGRCYENGSGAEQSLESAFQWYQKAASQGNTDAIFSLGLWYIQGIRVEKSDTEALKWFAKITKQGSESLYLAKMGPTMMIKFWGRDHFDNKKAFLDFHFDLKAALQGDANAQCKVGRRWKDTEFAYEWYLLPAEQGSPEGQRMIGECYYNEKGVPRDYKEAFKWYERAAKLGNIDAEVNIAECYHYGHGVKQDKLEAFRRFLEFAEKGNGKAQCWTANYYYWGHSVEINHSEAFKWYLKAAAQDQLEAIRQVGHCYWLGDGVQREKELAFKWYLKAAEMGDAEAQYEISRIYEHGIGDMPRDLLKAYEWCNKAAEQGNWTAQQKLPELEKLKMQKTLTITTNSVN